MSDQTLLLEQLLLNLGEQLIYTENFTSTLAVVPKEVH